MHSCLSLVFKQLSLVILNTLVNLCASGRLISVRFCDVGGLDAVLGLLSELFVFFGFFLSCGSVVERARVFRVGEIVRVGRGFLEPVACMLVGWLGQDGVNMYIASKH